MPSCAYTCVYVCHSVCVCLKLHAYTARCLSMCHFVLRALYEIYSNLVNRSNQTANLQSSCYCCACLFAFRHLVIIKIKIWNEYVRMIIRSKLQWLCRTWLLPSSTVDLSSVQHNETVLLDSKTILKIWDKWSLKRGWAVFGQYKRDCF